jgi:membrane-bound lytic murein transglycosylase B
MVRRAPIIAAFLSLSLLIGCAGASADASPVDQETLPPTAPSNGEQQTAHADNSPAGFAEFLAELKREAVEKRGISQATADTALDGIQPLERVLKRDRSQAEFKLTLAEYSQRVITDTNVQVGKRLINVHRTLLEQVAAAYGVQPQFIVAIWGIETRFGAITGKEHVLPGLVTLAFDRRRSSYFREQVFAALEMADKGYIELERMKGSWAGAMGQPQFMPSSYLDYAQDFDGDGHPDIWDSEADVFASIANYLARHGWSDSLTWGREVRLPTGFQGTVEALAYQGDKGCRAERSRTVRKTLLEWQALGVRRADGSDLPNVAVEAALVQPDGAAGPSFLVYSNYSSILRYNCAHLYALTVGMLADRLDGR